MRGVKTLKSRCCATFWPIISISGAFGPELLPFWSVWPLGGVATVARAACSHWNQGLLLLKVATFHSCASKRHRLVRPPRIGVAKRQILARWSRIRVQPGSHASASLCGWPAGPGTGCFADLYCLPLASQSACWLGADRCRALEAQTGGQCRRPELVEGPMR